MKTVVQMRRWRSPWRMNTIKAHDECLLELRRGCGCRRIQSRRVADLEVWEPKLMFQTLPDSTSCDVTSAALVFSRLSCYPISESC